MKVLIDGYAIQTCLAVIGGRLDKAAGSYVFGDSDFEDKMERKTKALKPVKKPDGFKIPGEVV